MPRGHFKCSRELVLSYILSWEIIVGDIMGKAVRDKPVKDKPLKKSASSSNPGTYVCLCVCVVHK